MFEGWNGFVDITRGVSGADVWSAEAAAVGIPSGVCGTVDRECGLLDLDLSWMFDPLSSL